MSNVPSATEKFKSSNELPFDDHPELVFGLVGPIGVDLESVTESLTEALKDVAYEAQTLRITELMREVDVGLPLDATGYVESFQQRIAYANKVREQLGRNDALAILAISAIREFRVKNGGSVEEPRSKQAYIIRQFKRPEEVKLLRAVYGKQFIQISAYAPQHYRIRRIAVKEAQSKRGLGAPSDAENASNTLVKQDEVEHDMGHGQNVRDAFPLADLFVEAPDKKSCKTTIARFIEALFGDNEKSPTHDEYGMLSQNTDVLRQPLSGYWRTF